MKTLATSNAHINTPSARKQGVERNVRSSSAVEGISEAIFHSAKTGAIIGKGGDAKTTRAPARASAKKK
jgi:hypothetical protein